MNPDDYILTVLGKYNPPTGDSSPAKRAGVLLHSTIKSWAGQYLLGVYYSGSYAKGTAIKGTTDVDLFISLDWSNPLQDIYNSLSDYLRKQGFAPRSQNVSIGIDAFIDVALTHIDLIPARKHPGNTNDHSLFRSKTNPPTWTKTNVQNHINLISNSGRLNEIKAAKIWRKINNLDFPSFYLELSVLEALNGTSKNAPAQNFLLVLEYFRDKLPTTTIIDPSNSGNIVSDDINSSQKAILSQVARNSRQLPYWENIIW